MGSTTYEWILDHDRAGKDPAEVAIRAARVGLHEPA